MKDGHFSIVEWVHSRVFHELMFRTTGVLLIIVRIEVKVKPAGVQLCYGTALFAFMARGILLTRASAPFLAALCLSKRLGYPDTTPSSAYTLWVIFTSVNLL